MATQFDDIGKNASDLLSKGFPASGSFKVSASTKTPSGVSVDASAKRVYKGGNDSVELILEPKWSWSAHNVEFTGKLTTTDNYEGGVSVKNLGVDGTKLSATVIKNAGGSSIKVGSDFKNSSVAIKDSIVYPDDTAEKPIKITASGVVAYNDANIGAKVNYATGGKSDASLSWTAALGYAQGTWEASASLADATNAAASFWQKVTDHVSLAANFNVDLAADSPASSASFGSVYKYDTDTTVRSKVSVSQKSDFRVGAGLTQSWNKCTSVTIAADLNALQIMGSNSGNAHSFGMEVKFQ
jgi:hypothetical protein